MIQSTRFLKIAYTILFQLYTVMKVTEYKLQVDIIMLTIQ